MKHIHCLHAHRVCHDVQLGKKRVVGDTSDFSSPLLSSLPKVDHQNWPKLIAPSTSPAESMTNPSALRDCVAQFACALR